MTTLTILLIILLAISVMVNIGLVAAIAKTFSTIGNLPEAQKKPVLDALGAKDGKITLVTLGPKKG